MKFPALFLGGEFSFHFGSHLLRPFRDWKPSPQKFRFCCSTEEGGNMPGGNLSLCFSMSHENSRRMMLPYPPRLDSKICKARRGEKNVSSEIRRSILFFYSTHARIHFNLALPKWESKSKRIDEGLKDKNPARLSRKCPEPENNHSAVPWSHWKWKFSPFHLSLGPSQRHMWKHHKIWNGKYRRRSEMCPHDCICTTGTKCICK